MLENVRSTSTSQSPLVLSNHNNVYASPLSSLLSSPIATQPQLTLQSLISSLTPLLTPSVSKTGYPPKPAMIKSEKPFYISKLNNRIKKCSGCGIFFREVGTVTPDFVLGHLEEDWYPAEGCQWKLPEQVLSHSAGLCSTEVFLPIDIMQRYSNWM